MAVETYVYTKTPRYGSSPDHQEAEEESQLLG